MEAVERADAAAPGRRADARLHLAFAHRPGGLGHARSREANGRANPRGLYDLDRRIRPAGRAYQRLIAEWGEALRREDACSRCRWPRPDAGAPTAADVPILLVAAALSFAPPPSDRDPRRRRWTASSRGTKRCGSWRTPLENTIGRAEADRVQRVAVANALLEHCQLDWGRLFRALTAYHRHRQRPLGGGDGEDHRLARRLAGTDARHAAPGAAELRRGRCAAPPSGAKRASSRRWRRRAARPDRRGGTAARLSAAQPARPPRAWPSP